MELKKLKNIIKELIKEQKGPNHPAGAPGVNFQGQTLSGTYTAVVDSGNQKVNIKCPQGQEVRTIAANIPTGPVPAGANIPTPGQVLSINTTYGVTVRCYPITPVQGGQVSTDR